ncbi:MAG: penicillin-binding protein activator [Ignavibacteriae bacterium]|nr:penicillin-binding protein activator [Ignavibacteriota bacterium]
MKIIMILLFISLILVSGCISQVSDKQAAKIGIIIPLTGASSDAGNYVRQGMLLGQGEINNATNRKYNVELILEDSQFKSDLAVSAMQKLMNLDSVKFVIGELGSSQTLALAPIAEENKIILITPGAQTTKITDAGNYIFRTQINTRQEAEFFSGFIKDKAGNKPLALIVWNTDYGISYVDDYMRFYNETGSVIGSVQKFDTQETDFRTILLKIKDNGERNALIAGNRKHIGTILKQASELGMNITFFASSLAEGKDMLDTAGSAAEGLMYPYPLDSESTDTVQQEFQTKYQQLYGTKSEMYGATGYDTLYILSNCFEKVGTDVEKVKQCLYDTKDYRGASGILSFDKNGDVSKPFIIKTIRNGTFMKYEE